MAKYRRQPLDAAFLALGDSTRRGMLEQLSAGEASVSQFAERFGVSLPTIHKHLHVLERAGLVSHEKRGRVRHVRLAAPRTRKCADGRRAQFSPLHEATHWMARLEAHWDQHLLRLKHQVESDL